MQSSRLLVTALAATVVAGAMAVERDDLRLRQTQSALVHTQLAADRTSATSGGGATFAQHMFRDPGIFCEYVCDFSKDWVRALRGFECGTVISPLKGSGRVDHQVCALDRSHDARFIIHIHLCELSL